MANHTHHLQLKKVLMCLIIMYFLDSWELQCAKLKICQWGISVFTKLTFRFDIEPNSLLGLLVLVILDFGKVLVEDALDVVKKIFKIVFDILLQLLLFLWRNLSLSVLMQTSRPLRFFYIFFSDWSHELEARHVEPSLVIDSAQLFFELLLLSFDLFFLLLLLQKKLALLLKLLPSLFVLAALHSTDDSKSNVEGKKKAKKSE